MVTKVIKKLVFYMVAEYSFTLHKCLPKQHILRQFYLSTHSCHIPVKVKVKFSLEQATKAQSGSRSIAISITSVLDRGRWSAPRPAALLPGKTQYPLHRRLGESQAGLHGYRKYRPLLRFDPLTVQPVPSRYTD